MLNIFNIKEFDGKIYQFVVNAMIFQINETNSRKC